MKLLVVHSHPLLAVTLSALMQRCGSRIRVVRSDGIDEAVRIAIQDRDCIGAFLDVGTTHGCAGAVRELAHRAIPVIALSSSPLHLRAALECGAMGCICGQASEDAILCALLMLLAGEARAPVHSRRASHAAVATSRPPELTERQRTVLRHLCAGNANKDIGRELHISEKTVKTHVSAILKALGVANRTQAVVAAREAQLLES